MCHTLKYFTLKSFLEKCVPGWFGPDCLHSCEMCLNGGKCNAKKDGCDCTAGWTGVVCDKACPEVSSLYVKEFTLISYSILRCYQS